MLRKKLYDDQIQALKNHDAKRLSVLRYILAQIKNKEIEKNPPAGGELNDQETVFILRKIAKELHESIEAFNKGQRQDLVKEYKQQLEIVSAYLPQEMSDEELKKAVEKIIADNQEIYAKNPKAVIGVCMKELRSKVDPARILKQINALEKQ